MRANEAIEQKKLQTTTNRFEVQGLSDNYHGDEMGGAGGGG